MKSIYQIWDKNALNEFKPDREHAIYSPSKFHRLVNCPYSHKFDKPKGTRDKLMDAAINGTIAHKLAAYKLIYGIESPEVDRLKKEIDVYDKKTSDLSTLDRDTDRYCQYIIDMIGDFSFVRVEEPLDLSNWIDGTFGTCDCFVFNPNSLTIVDFKYGLKPVKAEHNEQLIAYAVGVVLAFGARVIPEEINLVVYQPRTKGNTVDKWTIDFKTLKEEASRIKNGIMTIENATLNDRHAGNWCEYCENQICPMKLKYISDLVKFDSNGEYLTDNDLIQFQEKRREVTRLLDNFNDVINELFESGEVLHDYVMQYSNGRKVWKDPEEVKRIMIENNIDAFLVPSPAQLEKIIGKHTFEIFHFSDQINQTKKKSGFISR